MRRSLSVGLLALALLAGAPVAGRTAVFRTSGPPVKAPQGDVWIQPMTEIALYYVPAGEFVMGTTEERLEAIVKVVRPGYPAEDQATYLQRAFGGEVPPRKVSLSAFWIGKYEVTNEQYGRFLERNPEYPVPPLFPTPSAETPPDEVRRRAVEGRELSAYAWDPRERTPPRGRERHPVVMVTARDCEAFCQWADLDMPTEAEWEKAAGWYQDRFPSRGELYDELGPGTGQGNGIAKNYPWGNTWHWWTNCLDRRFRGCIETEWDRGRALTQIHMEQFSGPDAAPRRFYASLVAQVGASPDDVSPYGCLDMGGNVSEICRAVPQADETFAYVVRGGNFDSPWWECRVQHRAHFNGPGDPGLSTGFRCVYRVR